MKKVILHHTCKQDGGEDFVLENAPFLAKDDPAKKKYQFLGEGYYFWEDDVEQAHKWGKTHYKNCYFIVEFDCEIDEVYLLDLTSREGQKMISFYQKEIKERLSKIPNNKKSYQNWTLSQLIKFLFSSKNGIKFEYKYIKTKDNTASVDKIKFVNSKENHTHLRDFFIYFFKDKKDIYCFKKNILNP